MPIENVVWAHQAEYYAAIRAVEEHDMDIAPFIEFMLDKTLRKPKTDFSALTMRWSSIPAITRPNRTWAFD